MKKQIPTKYDSHPDLIPVARRTAPDKGVGFSWMGEHRMGYGHTCIDCGHKPGDKAGDPNWGKCTRD